MKKIGFIFLILFIFEAGFGLFYAASEHRKGDYFDPFKPSTEYFQDQIVRAWESPSAGGDLESYHRAAYSLVTEKRIVTNQGTPSAWVTPGFPGILAVLFSLFGFRFFAVLFLNAACVSLAYLFLTRLSGRLFTPAVAAITLLLLTVNLRMSMFVGYVYTESFFILVLSAVLLATLELSRKPATIKAILGLGLLTGFGILIRPVLLGLIPVIGTFLFLRHKPGRTGRYAGLLIYVLSSLVFIGGWVMRNHTLLGHPFVTTGSVYALAEGNQDFYKQFKFTDLYRNAPSQIPYGPIQIRHPGGNHEVESALILREQFREWKSRNETFYLWLTAWRMKSLWMPYTEDMSHRNRAVCTLLWLLIFPPALIAAIRLRRNGEVLFLAISGAVLLMMPAFVVIGPSLRYQIPAQLLFTLLAATEYSRMFPKKWNTALSYFSAAPRLG